MNHRVLVAATLTLYMFGVTACSDPNAAKRQELTADLQRLGGDYAILSQSVSARTARLADAERRLVTLQSELEDYKRRVNAFMMDHKVAVAALAIGVSGGAVALDPENEFSSDAKAIGGVAALLAAAYAIGNAQEVAAVADQLVQADSYVKDLTSQIDQASSAWTSESQQLSREQSALQELKSELESIRSELEQLQ